MKVLVHTDASGAVSHGLWWIGENGVPVSLYVNPQSAEKARGAVIMYGKENPEVSWEQWFDELTTRAPYFENWVVYDSMGFTPEQMLSALEPVRLVS